MKKIFRILIVIITIILIPQTIYAQQSGSGQKKVNKFGIFEYAGKPVYLCSLSFVPEK
jgi:hypothetical protein